MTDVAPQTYQGLRPYLFSVAYRFTGSASESEDLIQDAWLRYLTAGSPAVTSLRAYLTTIITRLALDYLKSSRTRREEYVGPWLPEPIATRLNEDDPALAIEQEESITMALLTLMDCLTPDQRVVYVLRESLGLGFDEIATHLDRPAATCRQLFRRARQRLQAADTPASPAEDSELSRRFLAALSQANVAALSTILAEDVVWQSDGGPHRAAARNPILGRDRVSRGLAGIVSRFGDRTSRITNCLLNGRDGLIIWRGDGLSTVVQWSASERGITELWFSRNPAKLDYLARQLNVPIAEA